LLSGKSVFLPHWPFQPLITSAVLLNGPRKSHRPYDDYPLPSVFWLILYALGLAGGMTGVISLVKETWQDNKTVRLVTYVFGGFLAQP
jgi:hypothetical protein